MPAGSLGGQGLDLLPVELSRTAVVLGVGILGGTPMLVEEGRMEGSRKCCEGVQADFVALDSGFLDSLSGVFISFGTVPGRGVF